MKRGHGLLALALVAGPAAAAGRFEREVAVPRPGLVRVELDAETLAALGDGGGVELAAPDGTVAGTLRARRLALERCRPVTAVGVVAADERYRLSFDLGLDPAAHAALRFVLDRATVAPGCRLEASADGQTWTPLGGADLFRLGEESNLAWTRIDYGADRSRFLRLDWPAAAGYPAVREVEVCAPSEPAPAPRWALERAPALPSLPGSARFRFDLPGAAAPAAALELEVAGVAPAAYRLATAANGRWITLRAGRWPGPGARARLELGAHGLPARVLRVELFGGAVASVAATVELVPMTLEFRAGEAGTYRLRYPSGETPGALEPRAAAGESALAAALGPARRLDSAPGRRDLGAALPASEPLSRRRVSAPGAGVGEPAALPLPDDLAAAPGLDLRLSSGGAQVPYRLESGHEPESLILATALAPSAAGAGLSELELTLTEPLLEGSRIRLRAAPASAPFRRRVSWEVEGGAAARGPLRLGATEWSCAAEATPCELELTLAGARRGPLRLRFDDGDAAPLAGLDAELERPRPRLLFVWPGDPVELLALASAGPAPRYDTATLERALALGPPASAQAGAPADRERPLERYRKPLLVAGVVAVAAALLALLARLLPGRAAGS